jgi:hypothetical protein
MKLFRAIYNGYFEHKTVRGKCPLNDYMAGWRSNKPDALYVSLHKARLEIDDLQHEIDRRVDFLARHAPTATELRARFKNDPAKPARKKGHQ